MHHVWHFAGERQNRPNSGLVYVRHRVSNLYTVERQNSEKRRILLHIVIDRFCEAASLLGLGGWHGICLIPLKSTMDGISMRRKMSGRFPSPVIRFLLALNLLLFSQFVPEPTTLALLGAGLLGLYMRRKRVA